jgi:DNA-binding Xre family transcriptional regulator
MRHRGIKGREMARNMGIGENYLSRVRHEAPDRLSLELLDALCRELGCRVDDLLIYHQAVLALEPQEPLKRSSKTGSQTLSAEPVLEKPTAVVTAKSLGARINYLKRHRG